MPITQNDNPMYHGEYKPSSVEFVAVGIFGIFLYFGIIMLSFWKLFPMPIVLGVANRVFIASTILMAVCDLPRYFHIAIHASYTSVAGYAMHIISGIFYFICLATVGFSFASILELGSYASLLYSKWGLAVAVVLHVSIDLAAFGLCLRSRSLGDFFGSTFYGVFIAFDILQNLLYSAVLAVFGVRLIHRFSNLERSSSSGTERKAFHRVVSKITIVLMFVCCFSLVRLILLGVKVISLANSNTATIVTTVSEVRRYSMYCTVLYCAVLCCALSVLLVSVESLLYRIPSVG
jgi:hypothetical protein